MRVDRPMLFEVTQTNVKLWMLLHTYTVYTVHIILYIYMYICIKSAYLAFKNYFTETT